VNFLQAPKVETKKISVTMPDIDLSKTLPGAQLSALRVLSLGFTLVSSAAEGLRRVCLARAGFAVAYILVHTDERCSILCRAGSFICQMYMHASPAYVFWLTFAAAAAAAPYTPQPGPTS
jgi:hypothetical protein